MLYYYDVMVHPDVAAEVPVEAFAAEAGHILGLGRAGGRASASPAYIPIKRERARVAAQRAVLHAAADAQRGDTKIWPRV